jgi:hypothetical protein
MNLPETLRAWRARLSRPSMSSLELVTLVIYDIPDDLRHRATKYLRSKGLEGH